MLGADQSEAGAPGCLEALQGALIACCLAEDSDAALAAARSSHPELGCFLQRIDPEGLRLTGLLIRKLRFERVVRGDPGLAERFAADPVGFTAAFRVFLRTVPPTGVFPEEEAEGFRRFLADPPV